MEAVYHERLVAAGSELLEKVANDQAEYMPDEVRAMLQDKDTLMGVVNSAHDAVRGCHDSHILPFPHRTPVLMQCQLLPIACVMA